MSKSETRVHAANKSEVKSEKILSKEPKLHAIHLTDRQRAAVTGGVMLGMFLAALEATVVSTAMPTVIADLKGLSIYSWVFSGYILTSTISGPIWGRLSDLYGRRNFYLLGIAIFLLGSALSGLAQSMAQLIIFRAIQGLGAGALLPLGMTITGEIYSMEKRARMQGIFSGVWGLASIVGPLVGGFITDQWDWRWVFFINIPFGLASMGVIAGFLIEPKEHRQKASIDYAGIALLTGAITALLLGLMHAGDQSSNWAAPETLALFGAFAVMLILFLWIETKVSHPLLPLDLFRDRVFSVTAANGFFMGMAMFGSLSFIPLFVQGVIGTTATEAGTTMTPFMLSWVVAATLAGRLMIKTGYRLIAIIGVGSMVVGFFLLTWLSVGSTRLDVMRDLIFAGVGMGFCMVTLTIAVQSSVARDKLGIATSTTVFFRSIGGAVGVAVMGAMMSLNFQQALNTLMQNTQGPTAAELAQLALHPERIVNPVSRASLSPEAIVLVQSSLNFALNRVFAIALIVAILAFFVTLLLPQAKNKSD
jgi:EmrB/QacA subfamily drug resistance transporter